MPHPFRLSDLIRSTSSTVWLVSAVWVLLLVVWSVLPPVFRAPDEPQHLDMVLYAQAAGPLQWVSPEGRVISHTLEVAQVRFAHLDLESVETSGAHAALREGGLLAAEAIPRGDRPSLRELSREPGLPNDRINQMAQHPPMYYRVAGAMLSLVPGWQDAGLDVVVGLLRLLSVLLVAPLPLLAAGTIRVLGGDRHAQHAAAVSPFVIPQVAHIGSVITNDALLITAAALLTLLCCRVLRGDHTATTGRWIGATLLVALLTKGFALLLPLAVAAAYLGAWRRVGQPSGPDALRRSLAWAMGLPALAGWWYGENLLRYSTLQPSVEPPPVPDELGSLAQFADAAWLTQSTTFWGRIGWAEVGLSAVTVNVASVVLVGLVLAGSLASGRRGRGSLLAVCLLPGVAVTASTLYRSFAVFGADGSLRAVQGRYAFVSLIGILVLAVLGLQRVLPGRLRPFTWVPVLAAAVALQVGTVLAGLRWFWTVGDDVPLREAVHAMVVWSPWSGQTLLVVLVLLVATVLAAVVGLVAGSLTGPLDGLARDAAGAAAGEGPQAPAAGEGSQAPAAGAQQQQDTGEQDDAVPAAGARVQR
ncbi:hypothetical protein BH23ACT9_BH23ACT9_33820 [soil metagenome]